MAARQVFWGFVPKTKPIFSVAKELKAGARQLFLEVASYHQYRDM